MRGTANTLEENNLTEFVLGNDRYACAQQSNHPTPQNVISRQYAHAHTAAAAIRGEGVRGDDEDALHPQILELVGRLLVRRTLHGLGIL